MPAISTGYATWYAGHEGQAAAGPALRRALGPDWRGQWVDVAANGRAIRVRLTDWCLCHARIIDLDDADFARFAPLPTGVLAVTVSWGDPIRLPETSTERTLWDWLRVVR